MSRPFKAFVAALVLIAVAAGVSIAADRVRLPSAQDTIRARIRAEQLLRGGRGPERVLPGRVNDTEKVLVGVEPDGTPRVVIARQTLDVAGVGDYFFKIPGPVEDVEATSDSTGQPGLRSRSVVWQGFSNGEEHLGAQLTLVPQEEADRLPIESILDITLDGKQVTGGEIPAGDLALRVALTNSTAREIELPSGDPPAAQLEIVERALRSILSSEQRPEPGADGMPRTMDVEHKGVRTASVSAPLAYEMAIAVPEGSDATVSLGDARVAGGFVRADGVLSGNELETQVMVVIRDWPGGWPDVTTRVEPTVPPISELEVSDASTTQRFDELVNVLAEAARLPDVDGYLGSPDPRGEARTSYVYTFIEPVDPDAAVPPAPDGDESQPNILAIALVIVLGVVLLLAALVVWSLS